MGLVDVLTGLKLITDRMYAVQVDFVIAGPINLWARGLLKNPRPLYIVMVSDKHDNVERSLKALRIRAAETEWPIEYQHIESNRIFSGVVDNAYRVALVSDPLKLEALGEYTSVESIARRSKIVLIEDKPLRLAPIWVELNLHEGENNG
ncbi:MAG: hypothetical protein F7C36_02860 [Desulfurococcales archaeon]|nr:hypothetical protein [Desulfurococcales archaeon]